jgi:hypothetical protein
MGFLQAVPAVKASALDLDSDMAEYWQAAGKGAAPAEAAEAEAAAEAEVAAEAAAAPEAAVE